MTANGPAHCPTYGTALVDRKIEDRIRRYCGSCEKPIYRNPKPCAGVLVVNERGQVLLVKRTQPPAPGTWSVPAGYLEADEPPRQVAIRELREETGLTVATENIHLIETVFVRHPGEQHVVVIIFVTSQSATTGTVFSGSDAAEAKFWDLSELHSTDEQIELGYSSVFQQAVDTTHHR